MRVSLFPVLAFAAGIFSAVFCPPAHADELEAQSRITAATVYVGRANVTRVARVEVPAGAHTIVFEKLPLVLDPNTLRVSGKSGTNVTFGAIEHARENAAELAAPREQALTEQLEALMDRQALIEAERQALAAKKAFVEALGKEAGLRSNEEIAELDLKPDQWAAAAQVIYTNTGEILAAQAELNVRQRALARDIQKVQAELNALRTGYTGSYKVSIPVEAERATTLEISLDYQVGNASWRPIYDARLTTESQSLEFVQYGSVSQRTGEDWTDVRLTLSTAKPLNGASLPPIGPLWVDLYNTKQYSKVQSRMENAAGRQASADMALEAVPMAAPAMSQLAGAALQKDASFRAAEIETGGFTSEYKIPGTSSILPDGSETKVMVGMFSTKTALEIHVQPRESEDAYLVARMTLQGDAPILPGQVGLFRDGAYIGQSSIPLLRPGEEHELFLGVDDQIAVKRKTLADERNDANLIEREKALSRSTVTEFQNLHRQPVTLVVRETIPVGRNDRIRTSIVKGATTAGYEEDADNIKGLLQWTFELAAQEKKDVKLGWKVSWPKDETLSGL